MPDEPNKKIEEQLKAWAQQRHKEPGAPVELHPAARQLLQNEVARTFAKKSGEPTAPAGGWWKMFWPRVALVGSLGVALVAVFGILLPGLAKSKSKSQHLALLREQEEISITASGRHDAPAQAAPSNSARAVEAPADRLGDETVKTPAVETRPAREVPALAGDKPLEQEAPVKAESKDARLKLAEQPAKVEIRKSRETNRPLELAYAEKATEALPPQSQVGTADRGMKPENASSRLLMQRYGLAPKRADTGAVAVLDDKQKRSAALRNRALAAPQVTLEVTNVGQRVGGIGAGGIGGGARTTNPAALNERTVVFDNQNRAVTNAYVLALVREAHGATDQIVSPPQQREADQPRAGNANAYYTRGPAEWTGRQYAQAPKYRVNFNSPTPPDVLQSFQVQQIGRQIRVMDADGSVYDGSIEPKATGELAKRSLVVQTTAADLKKNPAPKLAEGSSAGERPQNVFFRVAGTNRTLNQLVVLDGFFVANTNRTNDVVLGAKLQGDRSNVAPQQNRPLQSQQLLNAPIQGQATIGDRNRVQIHASPVGP